MSVDALVIGASGLVGSALLRTAAEQGLLVTGTFNSHPVEGLTKLDITDPEAVTSRIAALQPRLVILPAANPNVEYCEREPAPTSAVNVQGAQNVVSACAKVGAHLTYLSSDYVFDGRDGPYDEQARPSPICEYGRQKLQAEQIVLHGLPHGGLVIRTTGVFGIERQGKNFLYRLIETLRKGQPLVTPADQIATPTSADDLANVIWRLALRGASGVYHVTGPDLLSREAFARLAAQIFGLPTTTIKGVPTAQLGQLAPRPLNAGLTSTRLTPDERALIHPTNENLSIFWKHFDAIH